MDLAENGHMWHLRLCSTTDIIQLPFIAYALHIVHGAALLLIEHHSFIYQLTVYEFCTIRALYRHYAYSPASFLSSYLYKLNVLIQDTGDAKRKNNRRKRC